MTPDVAMRQDALLCEQIMTMMNFAEVADAETHQQKITDEQRNFVLRMEHEAGII